MAAKVAKDVKSNESLLGVLGALGGQSERFPNCDCEERSGVAPDLSMLGRASALIAVALLVGCGDGSDHGGAAGCAGLGDPAVRCRFVGKVSDGNYSSRELVRIEAGNGPGSLVLVVGPPGEGRWYVTALGEASGDSFSGYADFLLTDVFEVGTLQVQLLESGKRLVMVAGGDTIYGNSTFDGRYVGR